MNFDFQLYRILLQAIARQQVHAARIIARCYGYKLAAFHLRRCGFSIQQSLWILLETECKT